MKILIPDTIELGTPPSGFEVVRYPVSQPLAAENDDADVLVVWQNPASWLADAASRLRQLRLVQTLAAGPDAVLAAGFRAEAQISSGRSLHDATVAEHALALTLACTRRLDRLRDAQREHRWDTAYIAAQESVSEGHRFTLHGAAVTIWGFGSIAATLAPMLSLLGADVVGVAGSPGERSGFRVIGASSLDSRLAETDVLISVLPATPQTSGAFNAARMSALKYGARFVNIGRGSTVDETALLAALESGQISCAALDVFVTEPLPHDSPLWDAPNLLLTPHVAGNRPRGAAELVWDNVQALGAHTPLRNVVAAAD
jgi:phosphoglycerate dehydrogenase-like enzyme